MPPDLLHEFWLGPWKIEPLRGAVTDPDGKAQHLEPKVMDLFVCLAEHANELVTRDQLLETVWSGHAAADELLTRAISDLRHALQDSRGDPKYIETIPKRGYRLVGQVELPEGVHLETNIAPEASLTHISGRRLGYIIITLLLCAVVILIAYDKWWMGGPPETSIAVLPFENMSGDPEQEYFSDGISEEILNALAHIPDLHVTSRSSAFSFKGKSADIQTMAEQLGVASILEGSVRKSGSRIRISAQLIDSRTDRHLWSETYDRELEDIFAVQEEISAAVVEALKEHLGLQIEAVPRVTAAANTEAHEAYLRGRYLVVQRRPATVEGAVREFEKAIALDPDYALAYAELAIATLLQRRTQYGTLTGAEAISKAAPHAERAMALDPTLAEAYAATGFLLDIRFDLEEALTYYSQAIQINPNYSIVYTWMGALLGSTGFGRYAESFAVTETALRLDPLSIPAHWNYILRLIMRNRLAETDRALEKFASIDPRGAAALRGYQNSLGGKWANSVLGVLDALQIDPDIPRFWTLLTLEFAVIGLEKEALANSEHPVPVALMSMLGRSGDAVTTAEARPVEDPISIAARRDLALALASAGDYARARPLLEEMWQRIGGRVTRFGLFRMDSAAALIAIRRDAGEEAEVDELVAAIEDNVRRYHEAGMTRGDEYWNVDYEEGLAAYLAGDRERGLALIAQGAEDGFFIPQNVAYLQVLHDDPGFAPIRARQEARQVRERERFLTIVCTDNPYAAVWQPAEGTCERFAAVGEN